MNVLFKVSIDAQYLDDYYDHLNSKSEYYSVIHVTNDGEFIVTDGRAFAKVEMYECTVYTKLGAALK